MTGLQADVVKFFIFFLDLFLTAMSSTSIAFIIGTSVDNFGTGQVILVMIFVVMGVRSFFSVGHWSRRLTGPKGHWSGRSTIGLMTCVTVVTSGD